MIKLSICIPTFNRANHLQNCLSSLVQCGIGNNNEIEICVSDNCSTDSTSVVINQAQNFLRINRNINKSNIGAACNIIEVVKMAKGDFVWIIGDDDLLLPGACERIIDLISKDEKIDYIYVNANHLTTEYIYQYSQPFNLKNLPGDMTLFSSWKGCGRIEFKKLINPKISFDFLGGIYLSVFRRSLWNANLTCLDPEALLDKRVFSHFDNTFPHNKIFANAFLNSSAYFIATPGTVCLTGAREWAPMGPLVMSVRIPELLEAYRDKGLGFFRYHYCRNAALSNFFNDFLRLLLYKETTGGKYVNLPKIILLNSMYPNFYLSILYPLFRGSFWRKIKNIFINLFN